MFLATTMSRKVRRLVLPINSTDAELRILYMVLLKTKEIQNLLQALGLPIGQPTPYYEDNTAVINVVYEHCTTQ